MPATPSSDCSERLGRVRQPSAIWRAGGSASGSYAPRTSASADAAREAFAFRRRRITHRDIDSALALMSENVSWPKASEGGRVVGKQEIRTYWSRQWNEFDPHVEPLDRL